MVFIENTGFLLAGAGSFDEKILQSFAQVALPTLFRRSQTNLIFDKLFKNVPVELVIACLFLYLQYTC
jgi:hypothetical protein